MSDPLQQLADRLRKSHDCSPKKKRCVKDVQAQGHDKSSAYAICTSSVGKSFVKSAGPGGFVFDFGQRTGNPIADNFSDALNAFADPTQEAILRMQRSDFEKALGGYIATGVAPADQGASAQQEWNKSLSKSFDQQTVEAIKSGAIPVEPGVPGESSAPVRGPLIKGQFNRSTMVLGGEQLVAQSETDAAVIEMMKSIQDTADDGEFVIDENAEGI